MIFLIYKLLLMKLYINIFFKSILSVSKTIPSILLLVVFYLFLSDLNSSQTYKLVLISA